MGVGDTGREADVEALFGAAWASLGGRVPDVVSLFDSQSCVRVEYVAW